MTAAADRVRVEVHRDRCMVTGACVHTAPGVFSIDDDESVVVVSGDPGGAPDAVRDAVAECPMAALELVEG